ncbi:Signal transduction histidine kinase regulating C4-dicarboxylate transport system [Oscillochloris trichoides DG-6]|uniref:histidine kinase n=1 Tax=Oscillochloris trichoides DG-6 TaxID=765420 RepID=E1IB55_9CHLR|nr:ATP-binding protein [Oscillochloris trichoides]EFO81540.1 Signal transduction histidine kinase regulating C4-dicarboxylate transport system [Oscillochloris trichoides DG-6]
MSGITRVRFRPRARLLSLLGEQLISDQAVGLIELVKNGYDADATQVDIVILGLSTTESTRIEVRDNGSGMSRDDIEQKWLSPAIDHKERQKKTKSRSIRGRLPIGEKGVGRFAVHQLGRQFTLITRMAGRMEVVLEINWDTFDSGDTFLDDVPVTLYERSPQLFTDDQTGTYMLIERARATWSEAMLAKVHRALRRLQSPHKAVSDFHISLRCPDFPAYERIDSSDILDRSHYTFRGYVTPDGWLDYEYRCQHPAVPERRYSEDNFNLIPSAHKEMSSFSGNGCGPFHLTFYVWDRTQEYLNQSGVARADLDAMSGVSLFRDGLRVLPYGEAGNDWLDLDKERINNPSQRIGNQQIIGFVEVQQDETPGLRDKTNREGLIDNIAFRDLRALVRAAMNIFTSQWIQDRPRQEIRTPAPKTALQQAKSLATAVAATARDDVPVTLPLPVHATQPTQFFSTQSVSVEHQSVLPLPLAPDAPSPFVTQRQALRELMEQLQQAEAYQSQSEADANQREQVLTHLAATGMAAERVAHEFGRQVHAALEALGDIRHLGRGNSEVNQAIRTLDACLGTLRNEFRVLAPYESGWRLQRTQPTSIRDASELALKLNNHLISEYDIETIIEGTDFSVISRSASLVQVFDNIIHNACTWLASTDTHRQITITMIAKNGTVLMSDTGPGIPLHMRDQVFEPFITLRNGGRGLGLYITRELLRSMQASITLGPVRSNHPGAMFVLQFPIQEA